jgi:hypothetical protein
MTLTPASFSLPKSKTEELCEEPNETTIKSYKEVHHGCFDSISSKAWYSNPVATIVKVTFGSMIF